jgi:beta-galactosidase/beta-glucuronidase
LDDPAVLKKAEQQLGEEIRRDRDKASILLWSIANETPNTPERTQFLKTLAQDVRKLDSTRLVTAALLVRSEGHIKLSMIRWASLSTLLEQTSTSAGMNNSPREPTPQSGRSPMTSRSSSANLEETPRLACTGRRPSVGPRSTRRASSIISFPC